MTRPDLNLLFTLDMLLAERSVARAARRLRRSPSAMSRALARLRKATSDPLLVRAGRGMVASPRALELRDGTVDLETGVVDKAIGPEVRTQALFSDRYIGVVRAGHPLSDGEVTARRFAEAAHVHVSRRDHDSGPIDKAVASLGLERRIATTVGGFSAALALARATELVASVHERHTGNLYTGMHSFAIPPGPAHIHGVIALASAARWRHRAPLAAGLRSRGLSSDFRPRPGPGPDADRAGPGGALKTRSEQDKTGRS